MKGVIVKINSGLSRWIVASIFAMAMLSSQACFSAGQENLSQSPPAEDLPLDPLPPDNSPLPDNSSPSDNSSPPDNSSPSDVSLPKDPSLPAEGAEPVVIPPETPYGRQPQYQGRSSAAYHQPVYSRNWFRRRRGRMPHFVKLPPVVPPAAGENVNNFWAIQIANGEAARMVLYHFDFVPGQPELTSRGTRQLSKFADMLQQTPHTLIIQPSPELPRLDELRRDHVLNALAMMDVHVPEERVIIRIPPTRGLDGIDAEAIHLKQLGLTSGSAGSQSSQTPQVTPVVAPGG